MNVIVTKELFKKCGKVYTYRSIEAYSITEFELNLESQDPSIFIKKIGNNQASEIPLIEDLGGGRVNSVISVTIDGVEVLNNNVNKGWVYKWQN